MSNSVPSQLDELSDDEVFLVLQHLTSELRDESAEPSSHPRSDEEAVLALQAFVDLATAEQAHEFHPASDSETDADQARSVLGAMLGDPDVAPQAEELITDVPNDRQLGIAMDLVQQSVILGVLVTWLQTKVNISFHRTSAGTEVQVDLSKAAADTSTIDRVLGLVGSILPGQKS